MKTSALILSVLGLASAAVSAPGYAADKAHGVGQAGVLLKADQLPAAARASLRSAIAQELTQFPGRFDAVASVGGCTAEVYGKYRNPRPGCMTELRDLGKEHAVAMVAALAFDPPRTAAGKAPYATGVEQNAYADALVEALGIFRVAVAAPVLHTVLDKADASHWKLAAAALGRLGGDVEAHRLIELAGAANPRQLAAIHGLGECKRPDATAALVALLDSKPEPTVAALVAEALGRNASSWAWKALGPAKEQMGQDVRAIAAKAVVAALAVYQDDAVVGELREALMMAEHPDTVTMLSELRAGLDAAGKARIDGVLRRYQAHAVRK